MDDFQTDTAQNANEASMSNVVAQIRAPNPMFSSDVDPLSDVQLSGNEKPATVKDVEGIVEAIKNSFSKFIDIQRSYIDSENFSSSASSIENDKETNNLNNSNEEIEKQLNNETEKTISSELTKQQISDIINISKNEILDKNDIVLSEINEVKGTLSSLKDSSENISQKLLENTDNVENDSLAKNEEHKNDNIEKSFLDFFEIVEDNKNVIVSNIEDIKESLLENNKNEISRPLSDNLQKDVSIDALKGISGTFTDAIDGLTEKISLSDVEKNNEKDDSVLDDDKHISNQKKSDEIDNLSPKISEMQSVTNVIENSETNIITERVVNNIIEHSESADENSVNLNKTEVVSELESPYVSIVTPEFSENSNDFEEQSEDKSNSNGYSFEEHIETIEKKLDSLVLDSNDIANSIVGLSSEGIAHSAVEMMLESASFQVMMSECIEGSTTPLIETINGKLSKIINDSNKENTSEQIVRTKETERIIEKIETHDTETIVEKPLNIIKNSNEATKIDETETRPEFEVVEVPSKTVVEKLIVEKPSEITVEKNETHEFSDAQILSLQNKIAPKKDNLENDFEKNHNVVENFGETISTKLNVDNSINTEVTNTTNISEVPYENEELNDSASFIEWFKKLGSELENIEELSKKEVPSVTTEAFTVVPKIRGEDIGKTFEEHVGRAISDVRYVDDENTDNTISVLNSIKDEISKNRDFMARNFNSIEEGLKSIKIPKGDVGMQIIGNSQSIDFEVERIG